MNQSLLLPSSSSSAQQQVIITKMENNRNNTSSYVEVPPPPPNATSLAHDNYQQQQQTPASDVNNSDANNDNNNNNNIQDDQQQPAQTKIIGDINLKGQFAKKILGRAWAPCGISSKWYSGCIFPPSAPSHFICTGATITVLVVLFSVFVVPSDEVWSRVIIFILWALNLTVMFLGTSTDPGIVLPARHGDVFHPKGEKNVFISNEIGRVDLKPCERCGITRPYRVSHCSETDVCVKEYDHFCGVFGITIGRRTMRYFLGSIWTSMMTFIFMTLRSAVVFHEMSETGLDKVKDTGKGTLRLILVYVYIFSGSCFFLCGSCFSFVHCHNAFLGRNERDAVRSKKESEHRAYGVHGEYKCSCANFCEEIFGDKGESVLLSLSEEDLKSL